MKPPRVVLTLQDEIAITRAMHEAEDRLHEVLLRIPAAAAVLDSRVGRGKTRARFVNRLEDAMEVAVEAGPAAVLAEAYPHWNAMLSNRWRLALSAIHAAHMEANKYVGGCKNRMSVTDLEQEGAIGLMEAAKRFEPDRGLRFVTYARWWARAQITRASEGARLVRLPSGVLEDMRNMRKEYRERERVGASTDVNEVAAALNLTLDRLRLLLSYNPTGGEVAATPNVDDDAADIEVWLMDEETPSPDQRLDETESFLILQRALRTLEARERRIVCERYGIGHDPVTLSEIGKRLRLSRERIRQLEAKALRDLRDACKQLAQVA